MIGYATLTNTIGVALLDIEYGCTDTFIVDYNGEILECEVMQTVSYDDDEVIEYIQIGELEILTSDFMRVN